MTIGDQPAFPGVQQTPFKPGYMDNQTAIPGMTYRQWLIGMIATGCHTSDRVIDGANWVVDQADAIIERLDKEMGEK